MATAVLLSVAGKRFLVTAKHVADIADQTHLLYPKSDTEAATFSGKRIRTNPEFEQMGPPACNFDLAVLHLEDASIHPKYRFLGSGQIAPDEIVPGGVACVATGHPIGKNKTRPKSLYTQANQVAWEFATIDPARYGKLGLDPRYHLAVKYDRKVMTQKGQKIRPPKMKGMSGGALWINTGFGFARTAIISERMAAERVVFGTRIEVAVNAVSESLRNMVGNE